MAFNWKDFLTFAENIQPGSSNIGPREAALRSVVSRAYYSAFHAALEFGKQNGFISTRSGDDHPKIRQHFRESKPTDEKKRKISAWLERLHNYRLQADYDNTLKATPENMAIWAIGIAKQIFQYIDDLSK